MLGRIDDARQRETRMMAAANENQAVWVALAWLHGALLRIWMRDNEQAEALAAPFLEHCDKYQVTEGSAVSRCLLGRARAQLGHETEGIALIRGGMTACSR
jgi:hypothetical protein